MSLFSGRSSSTSVYNVPPVTFFASKSGGVPFRSFSVLNTSSTAVVYVYLSSGATGVPYVIVEPGQNITQPCQSTDVITFAFEGGTNGDGLVSLHADSESLSSAASTVSLSFGQLVALKNGTTTLYGGIVIKWGELDNVPFDGSAIAAQNFVTPFGTQLYQVTVTPHGTGASPVSAQVVDAGTGASGVSVIVTGGAPASTGTVSYMAIGA